MCEVVSGSSSAMLRRRSSCQHGNGAGARATATSARSGENYCIPIKARRMWEERSIGDRAGTPIGQTDVEQPGAAPRR